jgi:hypothetical protein
MVMAGISRSLSSSWISVTFFALTSTFLTVPLVNSAANAPDARTTAKVAAAANVMIDLIVVSP